MRARRTNGAVGSSIAAALFLGCGDGQDHVAGPSGTTTEFEVIQANLESYMASGKAPAVTAQELFEILNDGHASNDHIVLSVRSAEDYEKGHIPGAINIPWRQIGEAQMLAMLPADTPIAVYGYTGHTGGIAATALNALGYDAVNVEFGIMAWTQDPGVRAQEPFSEALEGNDFPTETGVNAAPTYHLAGPDYTESEIEDVILASAVRAYVADKMPVMKAQALFEALNDGDDSNDPFVVSVRTPEDYARGHIPGAINIPWREITKTENLRKLPTDRQIVVYCYTGHTAAVATTALNMLGYDAINMKFGITAWTQDPEVRVLGAFSDDIAIDSPIEKPNPQVPVVRPCRS